MAKFEVLFPPDLSGGLTVTLRVEAENWMAALKTGLAKLGGQGALVTNVLVDLQDDDSIHVTEPQTHRVFRIRELTDAEAAQAQVKGPAPLPPEPAKVVGRPMAPAPAADLSRVGSLAAVGPPPSGLLPGPEVELSVPLVLTERSARQEVVELEQPVTPVSKPIGRQRQTVRPNTEEVLAEVFEQVEAVHQKEDRTEGLYFLLDLALEKIPCESGTMYQADGITGDLSFAAVRGPKAAELLRAQPVVPAGAGIAGFCVREAVTVAVSDVTQDSRFYPAVSEQLGYETRSVLCAPMMTGGRAFGCLQLVNRTQGATFTDAEVSVLSYIAHQAAKFLNTLAG